MTKAPLPNDILTKMFERMDEEITLSQFDDDVQIPSPALGVVIENPKYPYNVAAAMRACSCYHVQSLKITGPRVPLTPHEGYRLPREERMKGYKDVELVREDYCLRNLPKGVVPVAVELRPNSEPLPIFIHPKNAVYVFGPEDGSISPATLAQCHRFVIIPTRHCFNQAAAVYTILYDRMIKASLGMIE